MPVRKLTPAKAERLRADYEDLSEYEGPIERTNDDGEVVVISNMDELAAFHDISKTRMYSLRRNGWRLQRTPPAVEAAKSASADEAWKSVVAFMQQRIEELQAENLELRERLGEEGS